jgi:hypothetical protein
VVVAAGEGELPARVDLAAHGPGVDGEVAKWRQAQGLVERDGAVAARGCGLAAAAWWVVTGWQGADHLAVVEDLHDRALAVRRAWAAMRYHGPGVALDRDGRPLPPPGTVTVAAWSYAGRGYTTIADALLARSLAQQHREMRCVAREELTAVA